MYLKLVPACFIFSPHSKQPYRSSWSDGNHHQQKQSFTPVTNNNHNNDELLHKPTTRADTPNKTYSQKLPQSPSIISIPSTTLDQSHAHSPSLASQLPKHHPVQTQRPITVPIAATHAAPNAPQTTLHNTNKYYDQYNSNNRKYDYQNDYRKRQENDQTDNDNDADVDVRGVLQQQQQPIQKRIEVGRQQQLVDATQTADAEAQRQKILNFIVSDVQPQSFQPRPEQPAPADYQSRTRVPVSDGGPVPALEDENGTVVYVIRGPTTTTTTTQAIASRPHASTMANRYEVIEQEDMSSSTLNRSRSVSPTSGPPSAIEIVTLRPTDRSASRRPTTQMIEPTTYAPDTAWKMQYLGRRRPTPLPAPILHPDQFNRMADRPKYNYNRDEDNAKSDSFYSYKKEQQPYNDVPLTPTESQISSKFAFDPRQSNNAVDAVKKPPQLKVFVQPLSPVATNSPRSNRTATFDVTTTPRSFVSPYTSLRSLLAEENVRVTSLRPIIRPIQTGINRNLYPQDKWQPTTPYSNGGTNASPTVIPKLFPSYISSTSKTDHRLPYDAPITTTTIVNPTTFDYVETTTMEPIITTGHAPFNRTYAQRPYPPVNNRPTIQISSFRFGELDLTTTDQPQVQTSPSPVKNLTQFYVPPSAVSTAIGELAVQQPEVRRKMLRPRNKKKLSRTPMRPTPIASVDAERVRETIGDGEFAQILGTVLENTKFNLQKLPIDDADEANDRLHADDYYKIPYTDELDDANDDARTVSITERPSKYFSNYKQLSSERTLGNAFGSYEPSTTTTVTTTTTTQRRLPSVTTNLAPAEATDYYHTSTQKPSQNERKKFRATIEMPEFNVPTESEIKQFLRELERKAERDDGLGDEELFLDVTTNIPIIVDSDEAIDIGDRPTIADDDAEPEDGINDDENLIGNVIPTVITTTATLNSDPIDGDSNSNTTTTTSTSQPTVPTNNNHPSSTQQSMNTIPPRATRINAAIKTTIAAATARRSKPTSTATAAGATQQQAKQPTPTQPLKCAENTANAKCNEIPLRYRHTNTHKNQKKVKRH